LGARVAQTAAKLEGPAPRTVALDRHPGPDGPPEHWLRLVAEQAPELLEGGGIRVGMAMPRLPDPLPRRPDLGTEMGADMVRADAVPDWSPVAVRPADWAAPAARPPAPTRPPVHPSVPVDGAARGAVEPTPWQPPARGPQPTEAVTHLPSTVDSSVPGSAPRPPLLRRVLARLGPDRVHRPRSPVETGPPVPQAARTAEAPPAPATVAPARPEPIEPTSWRTFGWPDLGAVESTPAPVAAADPGLWGLLQPVPVRWGGDWRAPEPPVRDFGPPAPSGVDTRWPAPPTGGPWPWDVSPPGDRWPALPDDSALWTPPVSAFPDARVRRLDDEQRGL
jgi:hypothetical protein